MMTRWQRSTILQNSLKGKEVLSTGIIRLHSKYLALGDSIKSSYFFSYYHKVDQLYRNVFDHYFNFIKKNDR